MDYCAAGGVTSSKVAAKMAAIMGFTKKLEFTQKACGYDLVRPNLLISKDFS